MVSRTLALRRGLPRVSGGDPWPPEDAQDLPTAQQVVNEATELTQRTKGRTEPAASPIPEGQEEPASAVQPGIDLAEKTQVPRHSGVQLRQGLPRISGGEPWPPAEQPAIAPVPSPEPKAAAPVAIETVEETSSKPAESSSQSALVLPAHEDAGQAMETVDVSLRKGLPRPGSSDPWPIPSSASIQRRVSVQPVAKGDSSNIEQPARQTEEVHRGSSDPGVETVRQETAAPPAAANPSVASRAPQATKPPAEKTAREPIQLGKYTLGRWIKYILLGALGMIGAAALIVLAARGMTTLPGVPEFLERYPGEYHQETMAEPGFPGWVRWTHFLNFFLMVLIIRSGWQVRQQQKPPAFWTPKKGGKKISINLWLHTSLDLLWLANGVVFAVLLFASGHWRRIVPTSWDVFPNAASAMLQYLALDWPLENGWVNYNSLQQLMYFLVVFVAAPLAAITGVRMSEWWPKNAQRLNRIYPAPVARAIHFPVMLFFVLFIVVHVFLVFATGALRNLNHMFAGADVVAWTGFWWFAGGLTLTVAIVVLARPMVIAPIASAFGSVSQR